MCGRLEKGIKDGWNQFEYSVNCMTICLLIQQFNAQPDFALANLFTTN